MGIFCTNLHYCVLYCQSDIESDIIFCTVFIVLSLFLCEYTLKIWENTDMKW